MAKQRFLFSYIERSIGLFNWLCVYLIVTCLTSLPAWAQEEYVSGYGYQGVTPRGQFYKLLTGGFGSLVMVFMGLGGIATIFVTRQGKSGKQTPILGIVMLFLAILMFAVRIGIRGGLAGHEYMEW
jgi:hypothetical protein